MFRIQMSRTGGQSHTNCIHVACDGGHAGTICMRLAATRVQVICDWPPVACKLCMRQGPDACKAASFLQARCQNNYLNKKNEDATKKSENLRDICTSQGLSINTMHCRIQSNETVPLTTSTKLQCTLQLSGRADTFTLFISTNILYVLCGIYCTLTLGGDQGGGGGEVNKSLEAQWFTKLDRKCHHN